MTDPNDQIKQTIITPDNNPVSSGPSNQPTMEGILADSHTAPLLLRVLVSDLAAGWRLDDQQLAILSGVDVAAVQAWRRKEYPAHLSPWLLMRVSCMCGIHARLMDLFGNRERAHGWMRRANRAPLFGGRSALQFLLDGGDEASLTAVLTYLQSVANGDFS